MGPELPYGEVDRKDIYKQILGLNSENSALMHKISNRIKTHKGIYSFHDYADYANDFGKKTFHN